MQGGLSKTLRRALAVALSDPRKALLILDAELQEAQEHGNREARSAIARHAGVVSMTVGDLEATLRYYVTALQADPNDASLHLAIGDVHRRQGRHGQARLAFARSLELGKQQANEDMTRIASTALTALEREAGGR
jgi:tetratricopeptide (TPR) repeat protein